MEGITGNVFLFGVNVPVTELLLILSAIIIVYLIILEYEFRQIRNIVKKFDDEELILTKSIRELRDAVSEMRASAFSGKSVKDKE
ncbi:MAG: hypothetical protein KAU95_02200 [Candidatus Aenigmarchaeota archaeon]|nr:hypothetical protein [Candidatus Aenigmarchaeota archaeon]